MAREADRWGFKCRQCTSFVAWRINQHGVNFTNRGLGNADTWAENARKLNYRVDHSPSVGAIACFAPHVSGAGALGHVAYVAAVNASGSVVIEEYNFGYQRDHDDPGLLAYHHPQRVLQASQVSEFIHVA